MIETSRLIIRPLSHSQLVKYLENDQSLEKEFNVSAFPREISPAIKEALERNSLDLTLWTIIEKGRNVMIGDLCVNGGPDAQGEIQIGYGTHEKFRNMGYMTEAVDGMIRWARKQPEVRSIRAITDRKNIPSYAVLIKNRFKRTTSSNTLFQWRLVLSHY